MTRAERLEAARRRMAGELEDEAPPDRRADQDKGDDETDVDPQQEGDEA